MPAYSLAIALPLLVAAICMACAFAFEGMQMRRSALAAWLAAFVVMAVPILHALYRWWLGIDVLPLLRAVSNAIWV